MAITVVKRRAQSLGPAVQPCMIFSVTYYKTDTCCAQGTNNMNILEKSHKWEQT